MTVADGVLRKVAGKERGEERREGLAIWGIEYVQTGVGRGVGFTGVGLKPNPRL